MAKQQPLFDDPAPAPARGKAREPEPWSIDWQELSTEDLPDAVRRVAEVAGMDAVMGLVEEFGGSVMYIPKLDSIARRHRDRRIREEWDGRNMQDLCKRFRLSHIRIAAIVNGE